jgi:hypothetical protein
MTRPYPEPPWQTHGRGVFSAFRVARGDVAVPAPLERFAPLGVSVGLLAYVEYQPPSPLAYHELIWMPSLVRARTASGRSATGWYVARMYVDSEASLRGGREIWALPKTLARFSAKDRGVEVEAEDGTSVALSWRPVGPRVPTKSSIVTLQRDEAGLVRFRGDFRAKVRVTRVRVERFSSSDAGWGGFDPRRKLPLPGAMFESFESTMQAPRREELASR